MTRAYLLGYTALLVYGSLFPFTDWRALDVSAWQQFLDPGRLSRTDLVVNVLIYIPFGWLAARVFARAGRVPTMLLAMLAGSLLSFGVEYLQAFLPHRVASFHDWGWNTLDAFGGAVVHRQLAALGPWIRRTVERIFDEGPVPRLGVAVIGVWAGGQLFPFVPSPDVGNLRAGLRPVWYVLRGSRSFELSSALGYGLAIVALSILLSAVLQPEYKRRRFFVCAFFFCVLLARVPVVRHQLSLEALAGAGMAFVVVGFLRAPERASGLAFAAILGTIVVDQLRPGVGAAGVSAFNWIPFRSHLVNDLAGIEDVLNSVWPFLGFGFLAIQAQPSRPERVAAAGIGVVFLSVLFLEWLQKFVPGRSPDVTDAVIAAVAWTIPWIHLRVGRLIESGPFSH